MAGSHEPRILIVDDMPMNVEMLVAALEEGHELFFALNGPEALRLAELHRPDLILLDIMMPDMDGFEVCRRIRHDAGLVDTPVIFITALEQERNELKGLELGAVDYITKPVNVPLVRLRVRNQLELKRQRDILKERTLELEEALNKIRRLEGIIPICSYCKKIRNDQDAWEQLEKYITDHSEAQFSHGMCPTCYEGQMRVLREWGAGKTLGARDMNVRD